LQPRWDEVLEAVKRRRRFSWILLSQNARILGDDGATLRLGFSTAGARDSFVNSGSEEVLRQSLSDTLGTPWKVEAVVEAGDAPPPRPGGGFQPAPQTQQAQQTQQASPVQQPPQTPSGQQPQQGQPAAQPQRQQQQRGGQQRPPAAPEPPPPGASGRQASSVPPPVPPEEDMPADDDADLDDHALSGPELVIEGLGATIIEQIGHE
jgi:DNA polymerase-3 subunit gamma/tau